MADAITIHGARSVLGFLQPKRMQKVERSFLNKTIRVMKKDSENTISGTSGHVGVFNIIKKRVKGGTSLKLMGRNATKSEVSVTFKGKRPGLQHFGPNKKMINKRKSPKFKVLKNKPLERLPRGFFLHNVGITGTGKGVFQRQGTSAYPIKRQTGPSVPQMYEYDKVHIPVERRMIKNREKFFNIAFGKEFGGKK